MSEQRAEYEKLRDTYYFNELFRFFKESTGLAMTISYLILIISSISYLGVFYSHFDIDILKLITLEDILVTPIKNPDIIIALAAIALAVFLSDIGGRYNAKVNLKYGDKKKPWYIKLSQFFVWYPKTKKGYNRLTLFIVVTFLSLYIYLFADSEADRVQKTNGYEVMITLADDSEATQVTLLGTTSLYVMVYNSSTKLSNVYQIESVASLTPVIEN